MTTPSIIRTDQAVIDVAGLNKSFDGKTVVRDLNMRVKKGQIYGFLGPNGSGKTTTIRLLCGLLTPDSGSGTCLGFDILHQSDEIKRQVGYMAQRFSLYDDLSVRENLDFVARIYQIKDRRRTVMQTIEGLGLADRRNQLAGQLSGGWKQRLALAACTLHAPKLLLLDEPTAGVDPKARREFWDKIHQLAAEGLTVLVSTHYMDEAERCTAIAYLAYGSLIAQGSAPEVVAQSGLSIWTVDGDMESVQRSALARELATLKGVEMVAPFGTTLHVSSTDRQALTAAIAPYRDDGTLLWKEKQPTLEDVFIRLMKDHPEAPVQ
ncbi:ABC transporter ATP-binding protein [Magnetospira thiophila]